MPILVITQISNSDPELPNANSGRLPFLYFDICNQSLSSGHDIAGSLRILVSAAHPGSPELPDLFVLGESVTQLQIYPLS